MITRMRVIINRRQQERWGSRGPFLVAESLKILKEISQFYKLFQVALNSDVKLSKRDLNKRIKDWSDAERSGYNHARVTIYIGRE